MTCMTDLVTMSYVLQKDITKTKLKLDTGREQYHYIYDAKLGRFTPVVSAYKASKMRHSFTGLYQQELAFAASEAFSPCASHLINFHDSHHGILGVTEVIKESHPGFLTNYHGTLLLKRNGQVRPVKFKFEYVYSSWGNNIPNTGIFCIADPDKYYSFLSFPEIHRLNDVIRTSFKQFCDPKGFPLL